MLNFVFVVFGKDYKMRIFKFKLVLYFDIKIEMIDKDYVWCWDKVVFDCFFVGIVGEDWILNEGYVFFLYCDGLVFIF